MDAEGLAVSRCKERWLNIFRFLCLVAVHRAGDDDLRNHAYLGVLPAVAPTFIRMPDARPNIMRVPGELNWMKMKMELNH